MEGSIETPLTHDVECPICRARLDIVVEAEVGSKRASVGGGTVFNKTVNLSVQIRPVRVIVKEHICDYPKDDD